MNDAQQSHDPSAATHHERHLRTPTHELHHKEKLKREHFHTTVTAIGGIIAVQSR
ncbi:MAG: hypothetical protein ACR2OC_13310 [Solirubrobacterales bacterium]